MTTDQLKQKARKFIEDVWNAQNLDAVDAHTAPNFRQERPLPGVAPDRDGFKDWIRGTLQAFPDIRFTIDEQIAEGETVVTRWTARGTHEGPFLGVPATHKVIEVEGITIGRYADGLSQSNYVQWDALGMMQQLGVAPAMGPKATA